MTDILYSSVQYDAILQQKGIPSKYHSYYRMWLRTYLSYCRTQGVPELHSESLDRFILAMAEQGKAAFQQRQAADAVFLYRDLLREKASPGMDSSGAGEDRSRQTVLHDHRELPADSTQAAAPLSDWKRVYEELFSVIRTRHYSRTTLKTYTTWLRHFQGFTRNKVPDALTPDDVKSFLNYLAVDRHVAATTQNQAFNALLFLFRHILRKDFGDHRDTMRAKSRPYIPVVLSRQEVDAVLTHLRQPYDLVVKLLYGCGLRLFECTKLRLHISTSMTVSLRYTTEKARKTEPSRCHGFCCRSC